MPGSPPGLNSLEKNSSRSRLPIEADKDYPIVPPVRIYAQQHPFNLKIDEAFVARLTDFISELALKGMARQL